MKVIHLIRAAVGLVFVLAAILGFEVRVVRLAFGVVSLLALSYFVGWTAEMVYTDWQEGRQAQHGG